MSAPVLTNGLDLLRVLSQHQMYATARQQMRLHYRQAILPGLVGAIPPGHGAMLCLETAEALAPAPPVPRQVRFLGLRLVGIGIHPRQLQNDDAGQAGGSYPALAAGTTRVIRYIWLKSHQINQI